MALRSFSGATVSLYLADIPEIQANINKLLHVLGVFESSFSARDHVEFIVGQLQGLVYPHRDGDGALLGVL